MALRAMAIVTFVPCWALPRRRSQAAMKTRPAPPSAGPPGPWSDHEVGEGEDVPYRPTDAKSCRLGGTRDAGPGTVLGVWVVRTRCRAGKRLVRHYQRCLNSEAGRNRRCYSRIDKRCVRPVFLGRCWLRDRFFRRQVRGLPLYRAAVVRGPGPLRGTRDVQQRQAADQSQLHAPQREARLGGHGVRAAGGVGQPARHRDRRDRRHLPARLRGGGPDARVEAPGPAGRAWPHAAADVLREAPAPAGRHGLSSSSGT